jgi:hypothetical protein
MARSPTSDVSGSAPPDELHANAWCGEEAHGTPDDASLGWASRRDVPKSSQLLGPRPLDLADWRDPQVGWGVLLPDRDDVPATDKAHGVDAPEPIRELVARRGGAPIFRYRPDLKEGRLRRYAANGTPSDPSLRGARGGAENAVPYYLLIVGSPAEIPWRAQYRLQPDAFVGRLDLDAGGLARYIEALLGEWGGARVDSSKPVVWAADYGHPDITYLMRKTIAERLAQSLATDPEHEFDMAGGFLSDAKATHADLGEALAERAPAFVMTSSHGATYPLDDSASMRGRLGMPVDQTRATMELSMLEQTWRPNGVIWYAHACCSAGCDASSYFEGAVRSDSILGRTLAAITKVGACSSPLPRALLGGEAPARAFVGHVEPTFDWTLRDPINGQVTTQAIIDAFYGSLHLASRPPVGLALNGFFRAVAGLLQDYADAVEAIDKHEQNAKLRARRAKLIAMDRLAMVLLGDPTVRLPART